MTDKYVLSAENEKGRYVSKSFANITEAMKEAQRLRNEGYYVSFDREKEYHDKLDK